MFFNLKYWSKIKMRCKKNKFYPIFRYFYSKKPKYSGFLLNIIKNDGKLAVKVSRPKKFSCNFY